MDFFSYKNQIKFFKIYSQKQNFKILFENRSQIYPKTLFNSVLKILLQNSFQKYFFNIFKNNILFKNLNIKK